LSYMRCRICGKEYHRYVRCCPDEKKTSVKKSRAEYYRILYNRKKKFEQIIQPHIQTINDVYFTRRIPPSEDEEE